MTIVLASLVKRIEIITYIDDILVKFEHEPQMFEQLRNFH